MASNICFYFLSIHINTLPQSRPAPKRKLTICRQKWRHIDHKITSFGEQQNSKSAKVAINFLTNECRLAVFLEDRQLEDISTAYPVKLNNGILCLSPSSGI